MFSPKYASKPILVRASDHKESQAVWLQGSQESWSFSHAVVPHIASRVVPSLCMRRYMSKSTSLVPGIYTPSQLQCSHSRAGEPVNEATNQHGVDSLLSAQVAMYASSVW